MDDKHLGPLRGLKVLDAAAVLAGPVAATMLGDFGAEVVKLEQPRTGDFTRRRAAEPGGRSLQWVQEGRNKRSITLNLRTEKGRKILRQLLPSFDVLVINYRPATLKKWCIDLKVLQEENPRLVILALTGYGMTGPFSDRGAFDRIASAFSGLTYTSGEPERPPVRSGFALIDYMSAYLGAFGVMLALYEREVNGGRGQVIDLALFEAGFRASEDALIDFSVNGTVRERSGNRNRNVVPAEDVVCADGVRLALHAGTDSLFSRLAKAMDNEALASDERFSNYHARVSNQEALYAIIEGWARHIKSEAVEELLAEAGVPVSRAMSIADIAASEHYRARKAIVVEEDPEFGTVTMPGVFPSLSGTPGKIRSLGPVLGSSNVEIYGQLVGLSAAQLKMLEDEGVM